MRLLSWVVFLVLQIAFVPLALVGLLMVTYKQMIVSKRLALVYLLHGNHGLLIFIV